MDSAPTFDVLSQPLPILLRDGKTHANLTLSAIEAYAWNRSNTALVYGIELGLTIYALLIAYMCTRPEKRKSPIFILNILALIFNTIKAGFAAHYINGPFLELYAILASDFSRVPKGEYVCSVILVVCKFLALLCTEGSLVVQVHAVLATTTARQRLWLLMATGFFALAAVGCGFALTIFSAIAIMHTTVTFTEAKVTLAAGISIMVSIVFFMIIFVWKLGFAIWQRRRLGVRTYGPMEVLFIMGCCTMIVPSKFTPFPCRRY
ncbi:hypothetical protein EJ06DRAFT_134245 [Trichodelitschia bisporula]|uniref:Uncharacterized protein n=1 Tax=Trichodelitschia bisporula TaxID=703511 RepID=A0A6G1HPG1_9PEZI|nr:hypothetical protein EJ06DRAFT_134245 [Trichodelitschia bisporula]